MRCRNYIACFNENKVKGNVSFHQCKPNKPVKVIFNLYDMYPGQIHACHIHEFGDLSEGCKSLGAHLNLKNTEHGSICIDINKSHTGDLTNNIRVDDKGKVNFSYIDERLQLFGDIDKSIIGCSVVIHDGIDDLGLGKNAESKITGNAGGRMACAVIGKRKN